MNNPMNNPTTPSAPWHEGDSLGSGATISRGTPFEESASAAPSRISPVPRSAVGPSGRWAWMGGLLTGMLFSAALVGAYFMGARHGDSTSDQLLRETLVRAAASHGAETMAMATGLVDEQEGLFVLDFVTGELQCFVLNPRGPTVFFAHFRTNVIAALGVEQGKQTKYAIVTGVVDFLRGTAIARPAGCVVYVCDTNTGNIAAYGIPWNRTAAAAGRPQRGALVLLDVAKARNPDIIEQ